MKLDLRKFFQATNPGTTLRVLVFFPLLLSTTTATIIFSAWATPNNCDSITLQRTIDQFQDGQKRQLAKNTLHQCGGASVVPLADALSNQSETIRINAAQVLGTIGAEARPAIPSLLATSRSDRNVEVRHSAIQALATITQALKVQSNELGGWQTKEIQDLKSIAEELDKTLDALEKDKTNWSTKEKDLEALYLTRNGLQTQLNRLTTQTSYKFSIFLQQNLLLGLGIISLLTLSVGVYKGLGFRGVLNFFRPIIILLPGLGSTTYDALADLGKASDLNISSLREEKRLTPLDGYPQLAPSSNGMPTFAEGFHVSLNLSHNGLGKQKIVLYRMEIQVEDFQEGPHPEYAYQQQGSTLIGAGTARAHEFSVFLSGKVPEHARWIEDTKENKFTQARSKNFMDTGGEHLLTFDPEKMDNETIQGTVMANKTGLYRIRFVFFYNVYGEDRNSATEPVGIYYVGE